MQVISPVLTGINPAPAPTPNVNFTVGSKTPGTTKTADNTDTDNVDTRRYSKFDRTASEVDSADMSFGDFLDMLNPLQHIPVVSSVYRAITGDKINPVSRVAGDIMYGGVLGVASAIASGAGAIADSVMEAETGKDVTGTLYASLFGDDKADAENQVQIASTNTATAPAPAAQQTAEPQPAAPTPITPPAAAPETDDKAPSALLAQGIPLTHNKLPYGGAIAPVKSLQEQNMAMAMASATGGIRIGNMVYANHMKNGARALPSAPPPAPQAATDTTAITALPAAANAETPTSNYTNALATPVPAMSMPAPPVPAAPANTINVSNAVTTDTTIPPALKDDAMIMRALGLYRSTAERPLANGIIPAASIN